MKIAIITCGTKSIKWIQDITSPTKQEYANANGIDFIFDDSESLDPKYNFYFHKIVCILKHLDDYDYVLWMDVDAAIVNPNFNLIEFITNNAKSPILIAKDENGINAGVMIVQNHPLSKSCMQFILDGYSKFNSMPNGWYDQNGLMEFYNAHPDIFQIIDGKIFNSKYKGYKGTAPNQFCKDTFIIHIANGATFKKDSHQVKSLLGL